MKNKRSWKEKSEVGKYHCKTCITIRDENARSICKKWVTVGLRLFREIINLS